MDTMIGQIIDNYKIIEVIGRGGMGVVFKALDMNLEKTVALKMIDPFLAKDENFLKRFKTEAKALAKLGNPHIVGVYALRETEFGLFMVMEYVQAKTISEWIRDKGKFSIKEAVDITKQILNAIGHAHLVGVIHRDIKPNNILLCEDGTIKVMDFGLAKVIQDHSIQSTVTQAAAGTLYYMSPEQIKGLKNVDNRSDIYSIGMTIYEMLAGRLPFEKSESEYTIQKQIVDGAIPSPLKYNPLIPKQLIKFITKTIDKDPDKRYQNISDMLSSLSQIQLEETALDDKTRVVKDLTKQTKVDQSIKGIENKKKKIYLSLSAIVLIAALVSAYFLLSNDKKKIIEPIKKIGDKTITALPASLLINSDPEGATVIINGTVSGKTPLRKDSLNIANYSIVIKKAGYEEWSELKYIASGKNNIDVKLKTAAVKEYSNLTLNMVPGGSVFIDNKKISSNVNETVKTKVAAGRHEVKFVHPEFGSKKINVNLQASENKKITCYFQHQVNIQSLNKSGDAIWGTIFINGVNSGKTTPTDILLGPGSYKISVKRTGFKTAESDASINIKPSFEPMTHSLVFHFE